MKRDVWNYFISVQKQYNDMQKVMEKVNKEIEEGLVSDEQRRNFETYFNTINCNYERVAYIIHLLNQPPKFIQKIRDKQAVRRGEKLLKKLKGTQEEVVAENEEALNNIKEALPKEEEECKSSLTD